MAERVLTVKQPWTNLIMAGVKDVENRSWPVPSTLPRFGECVSCGGQFGDDDLHESCEDHGVRGYSPFPFRLWVHAGQAYDDRADDVLPSTMHMDAYSAYLEAPTRLGVLLGSVTVTGCHFATDCDDGWSCSGGAGSWCSPWAEPDCFHWTLADPQPLDEPIPMRGRQKLWTLPADVAVPA